MPPDTRRTPVTITLTLEEWDSLGFGTFEPAAKGATEQYADSAARRYARDHEGATRRKIAEATPGAVDRRACALAEVEARLPVLDDMGKVAIAAELAFLHGKAAAGKVDVDHLGYGPDHRRDKMPPGFDVTFTPHIQGGGSAFCLRLAPDIWFEGNRFPLRAEDRQWFIDAVRQVTGGVMHVWNDHPGPWVSVRWR